MIAQKKINIICNLLGHTGLTMCVRENQARVGKAVTFGKQGSINLKQEYITTTEHLKFSSK
jgi:hypothetical protein